MDANAKMVMRSTIMVLVLIKMNALRVIVATGYSVSIYRVASLVRKVCSSQSVFENTTKSNFDSN